MAIAGRVAIVPKGDWSAETEYKRLDEVTYNNTMFIAKKAVPKGTLPTNAEYWSKSIVGGVGAIATKEDAGIVKPADGLSIAEDGTLKVSIDGTTLTMDQVNNVIKLADTLKEKIGSALQPESIVNNQVTTETGYALDARQANPNLDGTLAKQISDLNSNLNKKIDKIRYDNSDKGVEISYLGAAFIVLYQGGSLGAAIYFVNSTSYVFSYTKISDTLANWKVTFSSVDKTTGTFNIAWNTATYVTYLIPLI